MATSLSSLNKRMDEMKAQNDEMRSLYLGMQREISDLRLSVGDLTKEIRNLTTGMSEATTQIKHVVRDMDRIEADRVKTFEQIDVRLRSLEDFKSSQRGAWFSLVALGTSLVGFATAAATATAFIVHH